MNKSRVKQGSTYVTQASVYGQPSSGNGISVPFVGEAQVVVSQGNPYRNIGKGDDVGGPFFSQKLENMVEPEPLRLWNAKDQYNCYTRIYPTTAARNATTVGAGKTTYAEISAALSSVCPVPLGDNSLNGYGATAVSRVLPTSPAFDGATAVAELISERKFFSVPGRAGSVSGEYLNYQLGISPAIGAFSDMTSAMAKSERILAEAHRNSGKPIRRQYRFPDERTSTMSEGFDYPIGDTPLDIYRVDKGRIRTHTVTTTEKWFSGAFTYYFPKEAGWERSVAELDRLYGIKPGVDTAWELVPFSFVADYFASAGAALKNINAFAQDGLTMIYGYLMIKQVHETTYSWTGPLRIEGRWTTHSVTYVSRKTTMQRVRANPYGFGVLDEDLSPRQLSILAALGLNRR